MRFRYTRTSSKYNIPHTNYNNTSIQYNRSKLFIRPGALRNGVINSLIPRSLKRFGII